MSDMSAVLMADELPMDVIGAEAVLSNHLEHKAEMDARQDSFIAFKQTAKELIRAQHYASQDIQEKLSIVESSHKELLVVYQERLEEFEHNLDAQVFHQDAEQAEAWITFRESFLGSEDEELGDSVDKVEEMLKKQEDFEKMLAAQEDRFHLLNRETKVEEAERKTREEEQRKKEEEERRLRELAEQRLREEQERRHREEEQRRLEAERRRLEEEQRQREEQERLRKEKAAAEARAKKLEEERKQKLLEEEERKRKEREVFILNSLSAQESPAYRIEDKDIQREGVLQHKNELDEGGRKAASRSWRNYYTVLIGPLLNFYKDKRDFAAMVPACPPINVFQGMCEVARDYQKKKNAFRLKLVNGTEYLFAAPDDHEVSGWVSAINHAIVRADDATASRITSKTSPSPSSSTDIGEEIRGSPPTSRAASVSSGTSGGTEGKATSNSAPSDEPPPPPSPPVGDLPEDSPPTPRHVTTTMDNVMEKPAIQVDVPSSTPSTTSTAPSLPKAAPTSKRVAPPPPKGAPAPTKQAPPPPTAAPPPPTSAPPPPTTAVPPAASSEDPKATADKEKARRKNRFKMFGTTKK